MKHLLESLIAERAPWLASGRFPSVRSGIDKLLRFDETVALAEACRDMPPQRLMSVLASLIACRLRPKGLHHIPRHGAALIVANHPTGIADGIVLHHILAPIRPDLFFYANGDILRLLPQLSDRIAPVEWRKSQRSHSKARETLEFTKIAIDQGRLGVIFPSGRLAKRRGLSLRERPWMGSAAMIAKRYNLPVIPLHIQARNSALFYLFDAIHPTLRDITLFHEVLNKSDQPFTLTVGRAIQPHQLPAQPEEAIDFLRTATLALGGAKTQNLSLIGASRPPSWLEALSPLP
jgi:putative hemolysin